MKKYMSILGLNVKSSFRYDLAIMIFIPIIQICAFVFVINQTDLSSLATNISHFVYFLDSSYIEYICIGGLIIIGVKDVNSAKNNAELTVMRLNVKRYVFNTICSIYKFICMLLYLAIQGLTAIGMYYIYKVFTGTSILDIQEFFLATYTNNWLSVMFKFNHHLDYLIVLLVLIFCSINFNKTFTIARFYLLFLIFLVSDSIGNIYEILAIIGFVLLISGIVVFIAKAKKKPKIEKMNEINYKELVE